MKPNVFLLIKHKVKILTIFLFKKTFFYDNWYEKRIEIQNKRDLNELKIKEENILKNFKIEVVNLNANDICNSKCTMCNIWQQKKTHEITPNELKQILQNPIYENLKYIGITGGEPTLRKDFPKLFESIIETLPNIKGLSTITNCIKPKEVINQVTNAWKICLENKKQFSVMISLDGFENTHDKVRGRTGNFKTAIEVLKELKKEGIIVNTGTTISKLNVWEVDELLNFLIENKIEGRFRVAEFIQRLYNEDRKDIIRNFSEDEKYHLILFFYKLIIVYEKNQNYVRTYKSIINILSGGKRLTGCPYHNNGVVLNSKGDMAYCAPKSKIIGNALENNSNIIFQNNLDEKERILNNHCDDCIHDYHAPITYSEKLRELEELKWKKRINLNVKYSSKIFRDIPAKRNNNQQIFITGWYGTETVGDKAILAGIIIELSKKYTKPFSLILTSLYPEVTNRTIRELNLKIDVDVIYCYSSDFISYIKGSDLVIMGGGPLMDLEVLSLPLIAFKVAKEYNIQTIIYGCGIGPLKFRKFKNSVKEIIKLADHIYLRDQRSINIARKWAKSKSIIKLTGDPAKQYVNLIEKKILPKKEKILTCFLREWSIEYNRDVSLLEFKERKEKFEDNLAEFIKHKASELKVNEIKFEHMHNFIVGKDDRDFSRYFIKKYFLDFDIHVSYNKKLSTVESIIESMKKSEYNVCMRFHSVLFADTMKTNYCAIDYTNGGKILNYLSDNKKLTNYISVNSLINENSNN